MMVAERSFIGLGEATTWATGPPAFVDGGTIPTAIAMTARTARAANHAPPRYKMADKPTFHGVPVRKPGIFLTHSMLGTDFLAAEPVAIHFSPSQDHRPSGDS